MIAARGLRATITGQVTDPSVARRIWPFRPKPDFICGARAFSRQHSVGPLNAGVRHDRSRTPIGALHPYGLGPCRYGFERPGIGSKKPTHINSQRARSSASIRRAASRYCEVSVASFFVRRASISVTILS